MAKQLLIFFVLTLGLPVLGNGVAQVVRTQKITSLQEVQQATDYLFQAFAAMLAKGTSIEYNTDSFYFASPDDEPYLYPADYLLSLNIEAALDYFNTRFSEVADATDTAASVTVTEEYLAWRDDADKRAQDLISEAEASLVDSDKAIVRQNVIAQMKWIREMLPMLEEDIPSLLALSRARQLKQRSLLGITGRDPSDEDYGGMIHGKPAVP